MLCRGMSEKRCFVRVCSEQSLHPGQWLVVMSCSCVFGICHHHFFWLVKIHKSTTVNVLPCEDSSVVFHHVGICPGSENNAWSQIRQGFKPPFKFVTNSKKTDPCAVIGLAVAVQS